MIAELLKKGKQTLSFEVFPPKKEEEFENAQSVLNGLAQLRPNFISVTYGAGEAVPKRPWKSHPISRIPSASRRWPI